MALIRKFEEIHKDTNQVHDPVECGYTAFEANGVKYLQIDTYGSSSRQIKGKVSPSIQIDERAAGDLMALLKRAFPTVSYLDVLPPRHATRTTGNASFSAQILVIPVA